MQIPAPPKAFEQWALETSNFIIQILTGILAGQQTVVRNQETLMATVEELQAALDRNTAAVAELKTAVALEIKQLKDAVEALSTATPPTQAQIDQLKAAADALDDATAALGADDAPAA